VVSRQSSPLNPADILTRLDWAENDDLEFKSAKGGLPLSLWETYSAMANTYGGVILLGVEDDGRVSGVREPATLRKNFWNTINNRGKVNLNLLNDADLAEVKTPEGLILAMRIPQAARRQRPVFLGQNPLTGTYRRNFDGDYRCTEQEVSRMLSDRDEQPADSRIFENFGLSDIDRPSLQQYRQRFASHKPSHPWLSEDDKGLLAKLGGWRRDRRSGLEGLTVAGLLMFGTDEAIREALPRFHLDYREKYAIDPEVRWTDRLTVDGTWTANLFQFYLKVIQRLTQDLKLPFQLGGDLFRRGETIVHEAIREALVNALIHADYQGVGGVVVEKFKDRFEFSNPGTLLVSFDQLMRGNVSECRNKSLQTIFMMIGGAEKAGSGVDKIRQGWESQHWRLPIVREQVQPDRVLWVLPMISLIPEESLARLKEIFGTRFGRFKKLEVQALVTADIEGAVDNARLRQITGSHASDMTRLLQGLVAKGALHQEGQGRWSRYRLPGSLPGSGLGHVSRMSLMGHSVHNGIDSVHNGIDSVHNGIDSVHKEADFVHKDSGIERSVGHFWSNDLETERIAGPARHSRRLPPDEMKRIILDLCRGRWMTRRDLAALLRRNPDNLRSRFLTPMVAHGLLQLRHPDKPNRADQAYSTGKSAADSMREAQWS
jgi:ATP-dependent DNA helicase RecG